MILYYNVKWFQNSPSPFLYIIDSQGREKYASPSEFLRDIYTVFIINTLHKWSYRVYKDGHRPRNL